MLQFSIWVRMNSRNYAENHGEKIIFLIVLLDLKKREQGRFCICNESRKNIHRRNISDEGFWKTYISYSQKNSYMCNYEKFS